MRRPMKLVKKIMQRLSFVAWELIVIVKPGLYLTQHKKTDTAASILAYWFFSTFLKSLRSCA